GACYLAVLIVLPGVQLARQRGRPVTLQQHTVLVGGDLIDATISIVVALAPAHLPRPVEVEPSVHDPVEIEVEAATHDPPIFARRPPIVTPGAVDVLGDHPALLDRALLGDDARVAG